MLSIYETDQTTHPIILALDSQTVQQFLRNAV